MLNYLVILSHRRNTTVSLVCPMNEIQCLQVYSNILTLLDSDLPEKRMTLRNVIIYEMKPNLVPANSVQREAIYHRRNER